MRTTTLVAALSLSSSSSAVAQSPSPSPSSSSSSPGILIETPTAVRYEARSAVVFTGVDIEGAVKGPAAFRIQQRKKVSFRSLVELRSDFRDALSTTPAAL